MSKSTVRQRVADAVLEALSTDNNKDLRKVVQGSDKVQLIAIPDLSFFKEVIDSLNKDARKDNKIRQVILTDNKFEKAKDIVKTYQDRWVASTGAPSLQKTAAYNYLLSDSRRKHLVTELDNEEAFLVKNFSAIGRIKKEIVDQVLASYSAEDRNLIKRKIDRGHGTQGGDAVSTLQIAQLSSKLEDEGIAFADVPGLNTYLQSQMKHLEITPHLEVVKGVSVDYDSLVEKDGTLRASYVPKISFQSWKQNQGEDARVEKAILKILRNFFEDPKLDVVNMKGSPSIADKIEMSLVGGYTKLASKNANIKTTTAKKGNPSKRTKNTVKSKKLKQKKADVKNRTRKATKPKGQTPRVKSSQLSITRLIGYMNAKINRRVEANMGAPGLVNRTGRFASSVKIVNAIKTPQGYPSIAYTYQEAPYQIFEQGNSMGSVDRDPRRLIDFTIREIAAELLLSRIYTRKV